MRVFCFFFIFETQRVPLLIIYKANGKTCFLDFEYFEINAPSPMNAP